MREILQRFFVAILFLVIFAGGIAGFMYLGCPPGGAGILAFLFAFCITGYVAEG